MPRPKVAKVLIWLVASVGVLSLIAVLALVHVPAPVESWLQSRVESALRQRYGPNVSLENLHVSVVPVFRVTLDNFVLPNRGDDGLPPLVTVRHVTTQASPLQLLRKPVRLSWVKLEGMTIQVPPKKDKKPGESAPPKPHTRLATFVIDRVEADGAELFVLPKQAGREPMEWDFHSLRLQSAGIGQPMRYTAELTNPKPPGLIQTSGTFGPWNLDTPSETQVAGHYEFRNADLSIFNGISGILSSTGDYTGVLANIVVDGTTEVPDFKLDSGARAVHLSTQIHAIVDGTDGNTYLQPVNAQFLNSKLVAKGEVAGRSRQKGKTISLAVDIRGSKVQDLLDLAVGSSPPMLTGDLAAEAKLQIPPGKEKVLKRIELAGTFRIQEARFAGDKTRSTVAALSRRAQGTPDDLTIQDVPAELGGTFSLRSATLTFSRLEFQIPGVEAEVKGSYAMLDGLLNFTGEVRLQAHVSQTMSGAKRVLLKPVDPLFARHNAGTYLPISVSGERERPQIKLDLKKVF
jgi:hypothetical protein